MKHAFVNFSLCVRDSPVLSAHMFSLTLKLESKE